MAAQSFSSHSMALGLTDRDGKEEWSPPPVNFLKLNVDGASFEELNGFDTGMLVRNNRGIMEAGCTKLFQGKALPEASRRP